MSAVARNYVYEVVATKEKNGNVQAISKEKLEQYKKDIAKYLNKKSK